MDDEGADEYGDGFDDGFVEDADIIDEAMFAFDVDELKEIIKALEEEKSMPALKKLLNGFCDFVALILEDEKNSKV